MRWQKKTEKYCTAISSPASPSAKHTAVLYYDNDHVYEPFFRWVSLPLHFLMRSLKHAALSNESRHCYMSVCLPGKHFLPSVYSFFQLIEPFMAGVRPLTKQNMWLNKEGNERECHCGRCYHKTHARKRWRRLEETKFKEKDKGTNVTQMFSGCAEA